MITQHCNRLSLLAAAVSLLAAAGTATAAGTSEDAMYQPESTISAGVGYSAGDDGRRFGEFNGINRTGAYFLGDIDFIRRSLETGTWMKLQAHDIGLDDRDIRWEHERQGNWGYSIEWNQIRRYDPYTVNTGLGGIGTTTQTVGATAIRPVNLESDRDILALAVKKYLPAGFDFQLKFRNEEKTGSRMWGEGSFGGGGIDFLTEPLDSTTRQIDGVLSYNSSKLQVSGGYYGSFYDQHNNRLNAIGTGQGYTPLSLPPGSQSHHFYVDGGYNFTRTMRGTFKLGYTHATQDDTFVATSAPGTTNLGAEVNTYIAQLGVTARPTRKLSVLGDVKYERRNDNTPKFTYLPGVGGTSSYDGTNTTFSRNRVKGKFEASYMLPRGFRVTGGVDYDRLHRDVPAVTSVPYRTETNEVSYRAELQRSISETLNGRLSYIYSKRDGSSLIPEVNNNGSAGTNLINPLYLIDRNRQKVRLMLGWTPIEPLSVQLTGHYAADSYSGPNAYGPRDGNSYLVSLDSAYTLSDNWSLTGWVSHEVTGLTETSLRSGNPWRANLKNITDGIGAGVRGKWRKVKLGLDVSQSFNRGQFTQYNLNGVPNTSMPDVYYRDTSVKVWADYPFRKNAGVRFQYQHDQWSTNDWQWASWNSYNGGDTITQQTNQTVNFFGVRLYYKFK